MTVLDGYVCPRNMSSNSAPLHPDCLENTSSSVQIISTVHPMIPFAVIFVLHPAKEYTDSLPGLSLLRCLQRPTKPNVAKS